MNIDCEPALAALYAKLQSVATINFTADADGSTAVLTSVSSVVGLFVGLPVFGPGVPRNTYIDTIAEGPNVVVLTQAPTLVSSSAAFKTGFQTTGRRTKFWADTVAQQPAMFMRHLATEDDYSGTGLGMSTVEVEIWIYSQAGQDPDAAPDITLNNLVRLVRSAFVPDDDGRCTLGGVVYWARVEGRSEYDPGDIDAQSKAAIYVKMTLP